MKARKAPPKKTKAVDDVDAFMEASKHPLKAEIQAVREIILGVSPQIGEAVKWNAPSFRTTEFFATTHLRSVQQVQLVFHRGAKVRGDGAALKIADPAGLMKWLGPDRCLVTLGDVARDRAAFAAIVRQWIKYV